MKLLHTGFPKLPITLILVLILPIKRKTKFEEIIKGCLLKHNLVKSRIPDEPKIGHGFINGKNSIFKMANIIRE